jgi:hypothetical protein
MLRDGSVTERVLYTNLAIVVFTNLGSEAGLICKPQLRPVTTLKCCEAVSRKPINKPFTYNGLPRFQVVSLLFGIGFSRILGDRRLKRKVRDGTRSTILYQ